MWIWKLLTEGETNQTIETIASMMGGKNSQIVYTVVADYTAASRIETQQLGLLHNNLYQYIPFHAVCSRREFLNEVYCYGYTFTLLYRRLWLQYALKAQHGLMHGISLPFQMNHDSAYNSTTAVSESGGTTLTDSDFFTVHLLEPVI